MLLIESEFDQVVPHAVISSYREAFARASSLTYRIIRITEMVSDAVDVSQYRVLAKGAERDTSPDQG